MKICMKFFLCNKNVLSSLFCLENIIFKFIWNWNKSSYFKSIQLCATTYVRLNPKTTAKYPFVKILQ